MTPDTTPTTPRTSRGAARPITPARTRWDRRSRRAEASYLARARYEMTPREARPARRPA